ncbi:MAG: hypothetical protein R3C42_05250 [Parvularculaceae bacterium]
MALVACVAALSAVSVFNSATVSFGAPGRDQMTPAKARAIGARWRKNKSDALARRYADALAAAGLDDRLVREIDEGGLFAGDDGARFAYRSEAMLRLRRFEDARRAADRQDDNPLASFIRARTVYALTPDEDAVAEDLRRALRGPDALAAKAWLLRARVALDANDMETAISASRRAREAGADENLVNAIETERLVRAGDLAAAATAISNSAGEKGPNRARARLAAMIDLRRGDGQGAARRLSSIGADDGSAALLLALAKWRTGDVAQAEALVARELALAPKNWMALDLAGAIARDVKRKDDAEKFLARLEKVRPALAMLRRLRLEQDPDAAFAALMSLSEGTKSEGAGAALLGEGAELPDELMEGRAHERALVALAAALAAGETEGFNPNDANIGGGNDPVALTLGGAGFEAMGEWAKADEMYVRASVVAPDFFRPVLRAAKLARRRGADRRAITLLDRFSTAHPDHDGARLELAQAYAGDENYSLAAKTFALAEPSLVFKTLDTAQAYAQAAAYAGRGEREAMISSAKSGARDMKILGAALFIAGENEAAAAAFRKSLIADPRDADAADRYTEAMAAIGRRAEARSLLDAIEAIGETNAPAKGGDEDGAAAPVEESGSPETDFARNKVKNHQ